MSAGVRTRTRKRPLRSALTGLVAIALAGVSIAYAGGGGAQAAGPDIVQVWSRLLPDTGHPIIYSSPALVDLGSAGPSVVVGDQTGSVYALNLSSGTTDPGWPVAAGGPVDSTASSVGSVIFLGVGSAVLAHTGGYLSIGPAGNRRWMRTIPDAPGSSTPSGVEASLAVDNFDRISAVVAGSLGQLAEAINASTGAVLSGWPYLALDSNFSTPAVADLYGNGANEIIQGGASSPGLPGYSAGGHIRILNSSGGLICQYNPNQEVDSSPAVGQILAGGGVGIVVGTGGYWAGASDTDALFALNTHCGVLWRDKLDGLTSDSPALVDALGNGSTQVAEGTNNKSGGGSVWLLKGSSGTPYWHVPVIGEVVGGITSANLGGGYQDLVVPTTNGLQILDGKTGATLAIFEHDQMGMESSPLVTKDADGTIGITVAGYTAHSQGEVIHFEVKGTDGALANEKGAWPMFHDNANLTGDAGT